MPHSSSNISQFVKHLTSHQAALRAFIVSMMPGSSQVDDVLQDTNVVLWEKMENFEPGTDFKAWAFAVARNMVKEHWHKTKRDARPSMDSEILHLITETWFQRAEKPRSGIQLALDHCLALLKSGERELLDRRYGHHESLEQQATQLDRPADSLRVSLFRIREKLRQCVQKRLKLMEGDIL